ncbi:hypothetical protein ACFOD4_11595 [Pseudoroseomonas globiformis]|uniref:Uncharacterized protein n=1 Tax=Teichococcus globiformis TaxID=2307229 RepID=A0ABV7G4W5_9PROT
MSDKPVMGFAWYDERSFDALRQAMPDMSERYDDWRTGATRDVKRAEKEGYRVIRVAVRPEEFFAWCQKRGIGQYGMGLQARRLFAADRAQLIVRAERMTKKRFSFF